MRHADDQPFSRLFLKVTVASSLACLHSSALTPSALRRRAKANKGSRERTMLKFYQMTNRELANAMRLGRPWQCTV